jgi:predicted  nucleic acid-binding Zn-ribbon protein
MAANQTSLNGILMESMVSLEKHLGAVEEKISTLFTSINNIMEYSSKSGGTILTISGDIKELKENLIYKDDLITQLSTLHMEISNIMNYMENNNKVSLEILERLQKLESTLSDNKSPDTSLKKGIFRK